MFKHRRFRKNYSDLICKVSEYIFKVSDFNNAIFYR